MTRRYRPSGFGRRVPHTLAPVPLKRSGWEFLVRGAGSGASVGGNLCYDGPGAGILPRSNCGRSDGRSHLAGYDQLSVVDLTTMSGSHDHDQEHVVGNRVDDAVVDRKSTRLNSSHANISYA